MWRPHEGEPLLSTLAAAVVQLADTTGLESFTLPYPAEAQRALDRVVLACLLRGADPPTGLPHLLNWCRERPIRDWPIDLPPDAAGPEDFLVDPDSAQPTQFCHEWWVRGSDSAAAHFDRQIVRGAIRVCRELEEPRSYTAFRDLLVNRPVLTAAERFEITADPYLEPVRPLIDLSYQSVPAGYLGADGYTACGRCRTLLTPLAEGGWWCERDGCRAQGQPPLGRPYGSDEAKELVTLVRPLRRFVTGPGRAEMSLKEMFERAGLPVQMWPGYDAYDLRVVFPDGWVWAVDVKDWAHPGLLGRSAAPMPTDPPYDEAFWAVPGHRVRARPDYVAVFTRNRPAMAAAPPLRTDRDLVAAARLRLRRLRGGEEIPHA
ncbi:hypothetical protein ACFPZ0_00670 [Streptomonospora nanhaiensis]|uniref:pPIWI_RE_Y domain-containing protein n=1 Tax=Streptomonospora nanhaiensis TaxID=1323731 RepID=UPI001C991298|nr:hypothetical protein [Streptomonospora nanhaiensis]MBX9386928.1 hypothetical protein [Streptomonospora nanhaiensis]